MSTSFTLPRHLLEAVDEVAATEMTNRSNVIRQALMNYITPEQRQWVIRESRASYHTRKGRP